MKTRSSCATSDDVKYYIARDKIRKNPINTEYGKNIKRETRQVVNDNEMREKYDENDPPVRVVMQRSGCWRGNSSLYSVEHSYYKNATFKPLDFKHCLFSHQ